MMSLKEIENERVMCTELMIKLQKINTVESMYEYEKVRVYKMKLRKMMEDIITENEGL